MAAVYLTQPLPRVAQLADRLAALGASPHLLTFSRLVARADAFDALDESGLPGFDRIVFISPSSVAFAASWLPRFHRARPDGIAAVGAGTARALQTALPGIAVISPPRPPYDADALTALPSMQAGAIKRLLVLRGETGREDWLDAYSARGVDVQRVKLYRNERLTPTREATHSLRASALAGGRAMSDRLRVRSEQPLLLVVTSVGIARQLLQWLASPEAAPGDPDASENVCGAGEGSDPGGPGEHASKWLRARHCLVAHPAIATVLREAGFERTYLPDGRQSVSESIVEWVLRNRAQP